MNRTFARGIVFGALKDVGVEPQSVTRKTKLSAVLNDEIRVDFVKQLNERLPEGKRIDTSHVYFTVGQLVTMAQRAREREVVGIELPGSSEPLKMSGSTLPGGPSPTKPMPPRPKPSRGK